MKNRSRSLWLGLALSLFAHSGLAQERDELSAALTLGAAVRMAVEDFAEVHASAAELSAAEESLGVAKKAYVPDADIYLQWNRATRNNVFGLVIPGGNVPGISGPVLEETSSQGAWGSAASVLLHWNAFDFGVRAAGVREAEALRRRAEAGLRVTEIEVSLGAMDAFIEMVGAESAARAAAAATESMELFERAVSVFVGNELRPGADLSFARAELARTRNELVRAEQAREEARTRLAEWLGRAEERIQVDGNDLLATGPAAPEGGLLPETEHPLVRAALAERDAAHARRDAAAHYYRPRLDVLASVYARGTGALLDGGFEEGSAGLWPETSNWAVGLAVSFPLLDFAEASQETRIREYRERAAEARYENARQHLTAELERARIRLDAALRIAENTPTELEAARALQIQARARYEAGLADVLEVAEAERILRRAETEEALARLNVWRARFELGAAEGDLAPVLSLLD
ncbi:MAG: TolC family protein [Vicinamibacteria bacterium]